MANPNLTLPSGQVISGSDPNYAEYARQQGVNTPTPVQPPVQPTQPPIQSQQPQAPQGSVAIDGAKYDTRDKQQSAFTNIQPIGNTLYGTPRSPVVPDVIPQTDFGNALSSEQSAQMESTANQKVGFNEKQIGELNKANERRVAGTASDIDIKNLTYAEGKGWSPTEAKQEEVIEPSTTDKIFNLMGNLTQERINAKEKAMKDQDLMAKGEAIAIAQTLANKLRTDLQNQGILDIKKEDAIRSKPILTSQIQGQLSEMSREQKLDTMIMQNNYNNALVELQIAEGNYDRAREIVKETADDAYNMSVDKLNAMLFKNEIEDMAAQKLEKSLLEEREMALSGYVHIKSPESLKGLTEDQIYRDPVNGNIYMKPEPTVSRVMEINGVTYGFDDKGNKIVNYGPTGKGGGGGSSPTSNVDEAKSNAFQSARDYVKENSDKTPAELRVGLLALNAQSKTKLSVTEINAIIAEVEDNEKDNTSADVISQFLGKSKAEPLAESVEKKKNLFQKLFNL